MSLDNNVGGYLQRAFATDSAVHAYIVACQKQNVTALLSECAQVVLCPNHSQDGCETCNKVTSNQHQDVICLPTDTSKNKITVADISLLVDESYKRPVDLSSTARVFLIDATNSVSGVSAEVWQNKLLKTLEEPTAGVYIFIGVTDVEALLPTVRSRCQLLKQSQVSTIEVVRQLHEKGYDMRTCQMFSVLCGGNVATAERMIASGGVYKAYNVAIDVCTNMTSTKTALKFVSDITSCNENVADCLAFWCALLRESIVYRLSPQLCLLSELKAEVESICNSYTIPAVEACIVKLNDAKSNLDQGFGVNVIIDNLVNDILEVRYRCRW